MASLTLFLAFAACAFGSVEFTKGVDAYRAGNFDLAAESFSRALREDIAPGTLRNLGNSEWKRGQAGHAIIAWEQALWVNPLDRATRDNLEFARQANQLERARLTWFELASTWLPAHYWSWLMAISLWLTLATTVLPGVLRRSRRAWHQFVAAIGLGLFLLAVPTTIGTFTRATVGFVVVNETPIQLTPTSEGEVIGRLASGDPVRKLRQRGNFLLVRAPHQSGWVPKDHVRFMDNIPDAPTKR